MNIDYYGNQRLIDATWSIAEQKLNEVGGNPHLLPDELAVIVTIVSAQGLIDNGGLSYFFESDWPFTPSYDEFSRLYRLIGANVAAEAIDRSASLFECDNPHQNFDKRQSFIHANLETIDNGGECAFSEYNDQIWDDEIWRKLDSYIIDNADKFGEVAETIYSIARQIRRN